MTDTHAAATDAARPAKRAALAGRGASLLVLAVLTLVALTVLQTLGGPGFTPQPAFAAGLGNCLPKTATKIDNAGNDEILSAPAGELISRVSIKAGTQCFVTPDTTIGSFRFADCYVIDGLATPRAAVRRIGSGPVCKDISNIQFLTKPAGELTVCSVAGPGVAEGENFDFTVGSTTFVVPAGSCVRAGVFPAGMQISVAQRVTPDADIGSIVCAENAACADANLVAGTVTVAIGAGENEVIYTSQRVALPRLTVCLGVVNYQITELTFTVGQTTVVVPNFVDGQEGFNSQCSIGNFPVPGLVVGSFPVGTQVTITETVPDIIRQPPPFSGNFFQAICTDSAGCAAFDQRIFCERPDLILPPRCHAGLDQITGMVTVTIGAGDNGVIFWQGRGD